MSPRRRQIRALVELRYDIRGSGRAIAILCGLSVLIAVCETVVLASLVQGISALGEHRSSVVLRAGPWSTEGTVTLVLAMGLVAALARTVMAAAVAMLGPRIVANGRARQRRELFASYLRADWATQSADKAGSFLQVLSTSVNEAQTVVLALTLALPALITIVVLLSVAFALDPVLSAVICLLGLAIGAAIRPLSRQANRAARADSVARAETASHVAGTVAASAEIAVLGVRSGAIAISNERIAHAESYFKTTQQRVRLIGVTVQSSVFLFTTLGLLVLSVGHWHANFTVIGTVAVLLLRVAGMAQQVQTATSIYGTMRPFIQQVRHRVEHYEKHVQIYGSDAFPESYDLTMRDVSYVYPGTRVAALNVPDFSLRQGEFVGILGPSGSGKSTLIQLILRLRTPDRGKIRVGTTELGSISELEFSAHVSYVPQNAHLISGTIMENIVFFRSGVSHDSAVAAAKRAQIHDEIAAMPLGYNTVLDAHVDQLSGGQKQRLALARALTTEPRILVLDEPTSALDPANEASVMQTLLALRSETTVVLVTHKTSLTAHCDSVYRVSGGEVGPGDGVAGSLARKESRSDRLAE